MLINNLKFEESEGWSTTLKRRYEILRTFILILFVVSPIFAVVNYIRGLYVLSASEILIFLITIWMFFYIRQPSKLRIMSYTFVTLSCILGIIASANSMAHPTVAVWNSLGPLFAFYLLGKRIGLTVTVVYVPFSTLLYLYTHKTGVNAIPLVAVLNVSIFMLCISWIAYHFEATRAETEKALLEDIQQRMRTEHELEDTVGQLTSAISEVKVLSGLLPICASCKKIKDDSGSWSQMETYIKKHSEAEFSHGICPDCARKLYPGLYDENE